ncbi:dihydrofolate reductase [Longilinea arvoryzae]|uniref:Dihydrofolate reductase n=1 Tax=Longilinea arvoryzae TaxID=360412 RepID=A0A0S7BCQ9_9CHLR|nr:dihydrofolate reductase family protein [Longilinea arvoryzae]GAP13017.1 dihydrofolate reductase [Longilinea arvoryzae]
MRKVIFQNMLTLDGLFEGPQHEIDWHTVDAEFNEYAIALNAELDTLLFGRRTYELMAAYWPSPEARRDDPLVADMMNRLQKVVFSRMLDHVDWENSRLVKSDPAVEVARLKALPGKNMAIFGSADLSTTLIQHRLIDEYRLFFNPIILGAGHPAFKGLLDRIPLKLVGSKIFKSGLVQLNYQPVQV